MRTKEPLQKYLAEFPVTHHPGLLIKNSVGDVAGPGNVREGPYSFTFESELAGLAELILT